MNNDEMVLAFHEEHVAQVLGPVSKEIHTLAPHTLLSLLPANPAGGLRSALIPRSLIETMTEWRQPITYAAVVQNGKVLVATRTKKGGEGRLHKRVTLGFGGHVNTMTEGADIGDTIVRAAARELEEELSIPAGTVLYQLWPPVALIRTNHDPVSTVHLAVVFVAYLEPGAVVFPKDGHNTGLQWCTQRDLLARFTEMERWSQLVVTAITDGDIQAEVER